MGVCCQQENGPAELFRAVRLRSNKVGGPLVLCSSGLWISQNEAAAAAHASPAAHGARSLGREPLPGMVQGAGWVAVAFWARA